MVVSHKYKYVYLQIPHTASTAIGRELCENYCGVQMFKQHTPYDEFMKINRNSKKKYFVFGGVRNPLDETVTRYFRRKNWTNKTFKERKNKAAKGQISNVGVKMEAFLKNGDADFAEFFKLFFRVPYSNLIDYQKKYCDYVIKFEELNCNFMEVLKLIGIEAIRPLPLVNKTVEKKADFTTLYTPDIIHRAKKIFGPFMRTWGYEFPESWGHYEQRWIDSKVYNIAKLTRNISYKHFHFNSSFSGRIFRIVRGRLSGRLI